MMSLRYGLRTAADLYAKLRRDFDQLQEQVTSDATFNFVVTAYHLREWIREDPSATATDAQMGAIEDSEYFLACRDLANASKHFELDPNRNPSPTPGATSASGFGVGRFGKGPYGVGEESIRVHMKSGESVHILDFARALVHLYEPLFVDSKSRGPGD